MTSKLKISLIILLVSFFSELHGQEMNNILEFLSLHPNKKAAERDSTIYPAKIILTPVITYAPETNIGIGVGMKSLFKMRGSGDETRTSNLPLSAQYTLTIVRYYWNLFF